eukprot:TRINITY_DN2813_c0_g1_i11.p1 TRINITY_DN2813_c0_g1~~TRINITY_DN2813_c0_g1_i11.p1  ORF type:complete len:212 (-),score=-21.25 TRINITY_DN2813_c0_g1_i11:208-843(-)
MYIKIFIHKYTFNLERQSSRTKNCFQCYGSKSEQKQKAQQSKIHKKKAKHKNFVNPPISSIITYFLKTKLYQQKMSSIFQKQKNYNFSLSFILQTNIINHFVQHDILFKILLNGLQITQQSQILLFFNQYIHIYIYKIYILFTIQLLKLIYIKLPTNTLKSKYVHQFSNDHEFLSFSNLIQWITNSVYITNSFFLHLNNIYILQNIYTFYN